MVELSANRGGVSVTGEDFSRWRQLSKACKGGLHIGHGTAKVSASVASAKEGVSA